jgi:hypothetical protein
LRLGEVADVCGGLRKFCGKFFCIAKLDVARPVNARPFGAAAQELAAVAGDTCGVERAAWNEELHELAADDIRPDDHELAGAAFVEQEHLDRVALIIAIELIVLDAVKLHRRFRRHHEEQCRTDRASRLEEGREAARGDGERALIGLAHNSHTLTVFAMVVALPRAASHSANVGEGSHD